jgi:ribonuclease HI
MPTCSNNLSEFIAVLKALESLPFGWDGTVWTDSDVTRRRFSNITHAAMKGITDELIESATVAMARLPNVKFRLLGGHPTKAELVAGQREDGRPVSEHNVWYDKACGKQAKQFTSQMAKENVS